MVHWGSFITGSSRHFLSTSKNLFAPQFPVMICTFSTWELNRRYDQQGPQHFMERCFKKIKYQIIHSCWPILPETWLSLQSTIDWDHLASSVLGMSRCCFTNPQSSCFLEPSLHHSTSTSPNDNQVPGNTGLRDQLMALTWVQVGNGLPRTFL